MYVYMFVCMGETLVDLDNFWTISKISIFQNMFSRIWKKIKKKFTKQNYENLAFECMSTRQVRLSAPSV